ncbi:transcriptional regulator, ArsR family (plasmid) [Peptoclostridium acidaminophilum DSM 3953]|uniref:Transcriptional regulator, ArsR family n=1 Tax=Peptoclostridium acidaminophilum DSM 3953 TaxID=1286171 RepID=W8TJU1_PEPAC|nr:metalloregulator ArsR/SmtB family transcription factor [Peptoclostridium acidaminophilum]AHM58038.1 transcriptional regulator, ArsR family [Peptoclostridium acidaminophilum DSM 3953]
MKKNYSQYVVFLKAIADETRLEILTMLSGGQLCACKILEHFNITQPTLSYHMKILCASGLVEGVKDGIWMRYSLNKENIDALKDLFDEIGLSIESDIDIENI